MKNSLLYILALIILVCCNNSDKSSNNNLSINSKTTENTSTNKESEEYETSEIICDSVYNNKGYKLKLRALGTFNEGEPQPKTIFTLYRKINGQYSEIFKDSIFNDVQEVEFKDFNNDQVKDILVQNNFDVRSNSTYYLYLVDLKSDKLKKIKGFEEIKNPTYIPQHDLINNYVMSGRNWTSIYKIQGDSIKDYGIVIFDEEDESGTYDRELKKAITEILTNEKNNR